MRAPWPLVPPLGHGNGSTTACVLPSLLTPPRPSVVKVAGKSRIPLSQLRPSRARLGSVCSSGTTAPCRRCCVRVPASALLPPRYCCMDPSSCGRRGAALDRACQLRVLLAVCSLPRACRICMFFDGGAVAFSLTQMAERVRKQPASTRRQAGRQAPRLAVHVVPSETPNPLGHARRAQQSTGSRRRPRGVNLLPQR